MPVKQETQEMQVQSLGRKDPLEKEMATHSSILAWEIRGWRSRAKVHGVTKSRIQLSMQASTQLLNIPVCRSVCPTSYSQKGGIPEEQ